MAITRKERDKLRLRLRECYRLKYIDDSTQLDHLNSRFTSESNPFIKVLRVDINERFMVKDIDGEEKEARGLSIQTFQRLFFDDDYLSLDQDTFRKLNLYCQEIEETINNINNEINTFLNIKKKGSLFRRYKTIFSYTFIIFCFPFLYIALSIATSFYVLIFLSLLLVVFQITSIALIIIGFRINKKLVTKTKVVRTRRIVFYFGLLLNLFVFLYQFIGVRYLLDNPNAIPYNTTFSEDGQIFVIDPAGLGYGVTSINFGEFGANDMDFLDVNSLKTKDTLEFYVFIDYQNSTLIKLTDVKAKIDFTESGVSKTTRITGILTAKQGNSLTDQTEIINLPDSWEINILNAYQTNTHGEQCGDDYEYEIQLNVKQLTENILGTPLVDLDVIGNSLTNGYAGACSQGHVIAKFQLIKK